MGYFSQVLGGTVIQAVFGALWYGPLNGSLFFQLAYGKPTCPPELNLKLCHVVTLLAAFGLNNCIKLLIDALDVYTVIGGVVMGVAMWAFGVLLQLPHVFYESRSLVLTLLHEIGHLFLLTLVAVYYAFMASLAMK